MVHIYFTSFEDMAAWAEAHPECFLTYWGDTQSGKKHCTFTLRKQSESVNDSTVPAV